MSLSVFVMTTFRTGLWTHPARLILDAGLVPSGDEFERGAAMIFTYNFIFTFNFKQF